MWKDKGRLANIYENDYGYEKCEERAFIIADVSGVGWAFERWLVVFNKKGGVRWLLNF